MRNFEAQCVGNPKDETGQIYFGFLLIFKLKFNGINIKIENFDECMSGHKCLPHKDNGQAKEV